MNKNISCIINYAEQSELNATISALQSVENVGRIIAIVPNNININNVDILISEDGIFSTTTLKKAIELIDTEYILMYNKKTALKLGAHSLQRMTDSCDDFKAGMVYADYFEQKNDKLQAHPLIEYQEGSLRDDFNFGSLILYKTSAVKQAVSEMTNNYHFAAIYDLRLKISEKHSILHLPELLYTEVELDTRKSGEKLFDYVDPKNREKQIEMEKACTEHLKQTGAYLEPTFKTIKFNELNFPVEASIIIPVKNREKTIGDAIESVLNQKTNFNFNIIVVDNHSTDKTTEIISKYEQNSKVVHIKPKRKDLNIGGCWNEAVGNPQCGKFAVQLDSDDLYIDETVLQTVVDTFYKENCAMLIGTYQMVNFDLEEIPPGLIDHKEWTDTNGRNNALRINGLGAPRAFYTPILRKLKLPNTSYGEDYAIGLTISRHYRIGRIYKPLYLCRRWDDNSDAALDIIKLNTNNFYKDKLRTIEFKARQQMK